MLTCKEDLAVWMLQYRSNTEPLAGFVKRVGAVCEFVALPGVGSDALGELWRVRIKIDEVVRYYFHPAGVRLRSEDVRLFADRIRREDTLFARLILRAVKIKMRRYVRNHRKVFVLPKTLVVQHAVLADARVGESFGRV